jgi:hypothetical protein
VFFNLASGCTSKDGTLLGGGFASCQTAAEVRNRLKQFGVSDKWRAQNQNLPPSDPRLPYRFIVMSGPFTLAGIQERFKLTFYNDRLRATEFSTAGGEEFIAALRNQHTQIPPGPREELILDRRTKVPLRRGSRWERSVELERSKIGSCLAGAGWPQRVIFVLLVQKPRSKFFLGPRRNPARPW